MSDERIAQGLAKLASMRGIDAANGIRAVMDDRGLGSDLAALASEFAFAQVWDRPGPLDDKYRSLVTIAVLATAGRLTELRSHVEIALNHGLSLEELDQALLQIAIYAGLPAAWATLKEAQAVLSSRSS